MQDMSFLNQDIIYKDFVEMWSTYNIKKFESWLSENVEYRTEWDNEIVKGKHNVKMFLINKLERIKDMVESGKLKITIQLVQYKFHFNKKCLLFTMEIGNKKERFNYCINSANSISVFVIEASTKPSFVEAIFLHNFKTTQIK